MDPSVIERLKAAKDDLEVQKIINQRDEVLGRFGPIFQPGAVDMLEEDVFRQFLSIKYNKHWTGLERQPELYADMDRLREALSVLVDETRPVRERVNTAIEAPGMGPTKFSAILHVAYSNKYGVWNGTSEKALRHFDLWPGIPCGATTGDKYDAVNQVLLNLAGKLGVDLWTLDSLWRRIDLSGEGVATSNNGGKSGANKGRSFNSREKSLWAIKNSVLETVKNSTGQMVQTTVKIKKLLMSELELEARIKELLDEGSDCCAITGLPFEFEGDGIDQNMHPSLDRIDSDGHYEASNVQLVCQFINFWKRATPDDEFRRLIQIVRDGRRADT